jgi:ABC-2 type transport system permease protein
MNNLRQAIWVEWLKARRSRVPLLTALGFLLAPLAGGFFMQVLKDPEMARQLSTVKKVLWHESQ